MNRFLLILICFVSTSSLFAQKKDPALAYLLQEKNYDGVIVLYDYNEDQLITSHFNKMNERVLPASTYKIFNTLVLLDYNIVKDTSHVLKWNGKEYKHFGKKVPSWYQDTNLAQAFRNSTIWYYKAMSNPFELKVYKKLMKKNKYGKVYGRAKDEVDFWNHGAKIGVSAKDQIKLLVRLQYFQMTFKPEHIEMVRELMIEEKTDTYTLRGKTGWTRSPEKNFSKTSTDLGWYIGYYEFEDNSYYFAVRLEKDSDIRKKSFFSDRKEIAKKAIKHAFNLEIE